MIFPSDIDYLVRKERQQDLLREIAHDQLVRVARRQQPKEWQAFQTVTAWLGSQMIKWGTKLQSFSAVVPAKESVS